MSAMPAGGHDVADVARSQLAFVNHLYAVVDRDTAEAAERSALLRDCADFSVSRIDAADGEYWTGRYLMMRTTYVELFAPGDAGDAEIGGLGSIGLALGGDTVGVLDRLTARADTRLERRMRRRTFGDDTIDWFHTAGVPADQAATSIVVDVWAMEYVASYFAHPASGKRPSTGPSDEVSRLRYNAGAYRGALLEDLASVDFGIERDVFKTRVRPMLSAAGFRMQETPDGVEAHGDDTSLTFGFATAPGLRALRFDLARSVADVRTETIGRSTLTVGPGREACWTFAAA